MDATAVYRDLVAEAGLRHGIFQGCVGYNFIPPSNWQAGQETKQLMVFVNGLMVPQESWFPVMAGVFGKYQAANLPCPAMLSYDRPGQGVSGPHPKDVNPEEGSVPGHRHGCKDAANELCDLTNHVLKFPDFADCKGVKLIFVCHSIGVPITRTAIVKYPQELAGLIFLDSNIANTDFVSLWPDPDAPDFDPKALPKDVTEGGLRYARRMYEAAFHPSVPNPEGISRMDLKDLLPSARSPLVYEERSSNPKGPFLTVVGHDPEVFAEQSWTVGVAPFIYATKQTRQNIRKGADRLQGMLKIPVPLTMNYINLHWHRYNEDLTLTAHPSRRKGLVIARGCGHFIQKEDPDFVINAITDLLHDIRALE
ncbi:MAG: hypothetical protein M1821_001791 [Bathelium mastoideum]|nr:MAG: hypothetical protein M1821_001791 [Bathelium mastoideum]